MWNPVQKPFWGPQDPGPAVGISDTAKAWGPQYPAWLPLLYSKQSYGLQAGKFLSQSQTSLLQNSKEKEQSEALSSPRMLNGPQAGQT